MAPSHPWPPQLARRGNMDTQPYDGAWEWWHRAPLIICLSILAALLVTIPAVVIVRHALRHRAERKRKRYYMGIAAARASAAARKVSGSAASESGSESDRSRGSSPAREGGAGAGRDGRMEAMREEEYVRRPEMVRVAEPGEVEAGRAGREEKEGGRGVWEGIAARRTG